MILDFTNTVFMDDSAALVVEQMVEVASDEDTECIVMGLDGQPSIVLRALNALDNVPEERFVENLDQARDAAAFLLTGLASTHGGASQSPASS